MNRRDLFRRIGGALCAAAMELGWREPDGFIEELENHRVRLMGQWVEIGLRYEWRGDRWERVDEHLNSPNAQFL